MRMAISTIALPYGAATLFNEHDYFQSKTRNYMCDFFFRETIYTFNVHMLLKKFIKIQLSLSNSIFKGDNFNFCSNSREIQITEYLSNSNFKAPR